MCKKYCTFADAKVIGNRRHSRLLAVSFWLLAFGLTAMPVWGQQKWKMYNVNTKHYFSVAVAAGSYMLYSPLGRLMDSGSYRPGDYLEVQTQTAAGCYLLRLTTDTYGTRTVKLILR